MDTIKIAWNNVKQLASTKFGLATLGLVAFITYLLLGITKTSTYGRNSLIGKLKR